MVQRDPGCSESEHPASATADSDRPIVPPNRPLRGGLPGISGLVQNFRFIRERQEARRETGRNLGLAPGGIRKIDPADTPERDSTNVDGKSSVPRGICNAERRAKPADQPSDSATNKRLHRSLNLSVRARHASSNRPWIALNRWGFDFAREAFGLPPKSNQELAGRR
jgi:hypothetical protein